MHCEDITENGKIRYHRSHKTISLKSESYEIKNYHFMCKNLYAAIPKLCLTVKTIGCLRVFASNIDETQNFMSQQAKYHWLAKLKLNKFMKLLMDSILQLSQNHALSKSSQDAWSSLCTSHS